MPPRSLEVGSAEIQAARTIGILRAEQGFSQWQLAGRVTAPGHPMSYTMLSRIERAQRGCDADGLVVIAEALPVSPPMLPQRPTAT
ncbi:MULTISPECIES: helix-turn-helix domain-containing protein [Streptomyces]|uniref:helix-turn-helix domain-containing protein n=1 Tax=Streptomyces TaxID=1883 RepID=UPI0022580FB7|nr:helix-turn-helix transcriptional regulator [Streptomyces sp. FT1]MCX5456950.1 helix-turn-helix transcriptional regulator [Streptomyces sp. FT1]